MERKYLFLCAASGALSGLSFYHADLSFFIWFTLAPFFYLIYDSDLKAGMRLSFVFGLFFYLTTIFWVGHVTKLGFLVLLAYTAAYPVVFFLISRYFFNKPLMIVSLPAIWVLLEWIREHIWCGFGWAGLGYSQYSAKYFIQPADIFGEKFISFIIVAMNVLFLELFLKSKNIVYKFIFVLSLIGFCFSYSLVTLNNLSIDDKVKVSIVQPNTAENEKYAQATANQAIVRMLELGHRAEPGNLLIFPEAAWPVVVNENGRDVLQEFAMRLNHSIIMGAVEEDKKFYNRALYIDAHGEVQGFYSKMKIVPFGEYVPLRAFLSFIPVINSLGDMVPGKEVRIFTYDKNQFGVLICFEDAFPVLAAKFARKSDFLVNITNDEWFKGEPEASQHLAIMVFRAVENRISIARAANTGISALVTFAGDINKFSYNGKDIFIPGIFNAVVPLRNYRSFYTCYPELFVLLCLLFVLSWGLVIKWRKL